MIAIVAAVLGALLGGLSARRKGGEVLDMVQYAAVYALFFGVLGMILSIILLRMV